MHNSITNLIPIYPHRLPVSFKKGRGVWLWSDTKAAPYLDALSGRGVCNLGHNHPIVVEALKAQADQLIHSSNLYQVSQQAVLAAVLCQRFEMSQAFFANSGAEAIEAALKMACHYAQQKGIKHPAIITLEGSYHGRTFGALQASGAQQLVREKHALSIESAKPSFIHVPYHHTEILQQTIARYSKRVIAILIEPILGDGGIQPLSHEFLKLIRDICNTYDYLMITDEIQTGLYRTGFLSACEPAGIRPDILVLAKALGNGFPISAYLVNEQAKALLNGCHGSTFAGNPLGCAVALSVLDVLSQQNDKLQVQKKGHYLVEKLNEQLRHYTIVKAIRGKGLMIGIELDHPCRSIAEHALRQKLLFDVVNENTIRLLPPLIISFEEIDGLIQRLNATLADYTVTKHSAPTV